MLYSDLRGLAVGNGNYQQHPGLLLEARAGIRVLKLATDGSEFSNLREKLWRESCCQRPPGSSSKKESVLQ